MLFSATFIYLYEVEEQFDNSYKILPTNGFTREFEISCFDKYNWNSRKPFKHDGNQYIRLFRRLFSKISFSVKDSDFLFIHSLTYSFIQLFIHSFIYSYTHSFIKFSFIILSIHLLIYSFLNSFIYYFLNGCTNTHCDTFIAKVIGFPSPWEKRKILVKPQKRLIKERTLMFCEDKFLSWFLSTMLYTFNFLEYLGQSSIIFIHSYYINTSIT